MKLQKLRNILLQINKVNCWFITARQAFSFVCVVCVCGMCACVCECVFACVSACVYVLLVVSASAHKRLLASACKFQNTSVHVVHL